LNQEEKGENRGSEKRKEKKNEGIKLIVNQQ